MGSSVFTIMISLNFVFLFVFPFFANASSIYGEGGWVGQCKDNQGNLNSHDDFHFLDITIKMRLQMQLETFVCGTDATSSSPWATTCTRPGWTGPLMRSSPRSGRTFTPILALLA